MPNVLTSPTKNARAVVNPMHKCHCNLSLRDTNHKKCLIASLNVNSLPNKFVEIKECLCGGVFYIISIQETKIDKTFLNSQFYIEGLKYFHRDWKKGGGSIIVYIKENIIAQQKKITCKQLETILLQLQPEIRKRCTDKT